MTQLPRAKEGNSRHHGFRPPWRATVLSRIVANECPDRVVSALAAVATVCGAALLPVFADRDGRAPSGVELASLQIVWIERDETPDKEGEPPVASGVSSREIWLEAHAPKARASKAQDHTDARMDGEAVGQGRLQLDLSLPSAPMEFRRGLLEKPDRPVWEAALQVAFQDRSLGGTLQRMSHRRICAELGRALVSQPQSHEAIASSMARHKCKV